MLAVRKLLAYFTATRASLYCGRLVAGGDGTIGDFGTVSYFAVSTLTTAVYDTWLGYSNLSAAAKISAMMMVVIVLLLGAERYSRRKQKLFQSQYNSHEDFRYELRGWKKWAALTWCWGLVSAAFIFRWVS